MKCKNGSKSFFLPTSGPFQTSAHSNKNDIKLIQFISSTLFIESVLAFYFFQEVGSCKCSYMFLDNTYTLKFRKNVASLL